MFCPSCGKEIVENSAFCLHCGSKILTPEKVENRASAVPPQPAQPSQPQAQAQPSPSKETIIPPSRTQSPILCGVLSFFICSLGHLLIGQVEKGIILFVLALLPGRPWVL